MASQLAEAHIEAERRLRLLITQALGRTWSDLPGHDRENVDEWLAKAVPVVRAGQRQSAAITQAYLARFMNRPPIELDLDRLVDTRRGTPLEAAYERPFVTLWSKLGEGLTFEEASAAALARAQGMAAFDVQAAMRDTASAVNEADSGMHGFQRVADGEACDFCQEVDGAYVKGSDGLVMALHNGCGCSLEPLTEPHRGAVRLPDGTEIRPYQYGPLNDKVAVYDHGELGPILGSPDHSFTTEAQALS